MHFFLVMLFPPLRAHLHNPRIARFHFLMEVHNLIIQGIAVVFDVVQLCV